MSELPTKDIIATPVPFPTLPIDVAPRQQRPWIQNNWWVLLVVEMLFFFAAFVALLIYYLRFVQTPGKRVIYDEFDDDGLSHHGRLARFFNDSSKTTGGSTVESEKRRGGIRNPFVGLVHNVKRGLNPEEAEDSAVVPSAKANTFSSWRNNVLRQPKK